MAKTRLLPSLSSLIDNFLRRWVSYFSSLNNWGNLIRVFQSRTVWTLEMIPGIRSDAGPLNFSYHKGRSVRLDARLGPLGPAVLIQLNKFSCLGAGRCCPLRIPRRSRAKRTSPSLGKIGSLGSSIGVRSTGVPPFTAREIDKLVRISLMSGVLLRSSPCLISRGIIFGSPDLDIGAPTAPVIGLPASHLVKASRAAFISRTAVNNPRVVAILSNLNNTLRTNRSYSGSDTELHAFNM